MADSQDSVTATDPIFWPDDAGSSKRIGMRGETGEQITAGDIAVIGLGIQIRGHDKLVAIKAFA